MAFQFSLQKVLEVKEHKKNEAQTAYRDSLKHFEETATELYHMLKKKEVLLDSYQESIKGGISIANIQQTQETLLFLQKKIDRLQTETQNARTVMNEKQQVLTTSFIDVKKYEKMKERKLENYNQEQKAMESKFLDEISVQQFMKR